MTLNPFLCIDLSISDSLRSVRKSVLIYETIIIRPITIGRKNWLFCDSTDGAHASVVCFTMIEMAKAYDLNVYKYLNFLLEKRPNARTAQKELEKLAPWNEEVQRMFARKMK